MSLSFAYGGNIPLKYISFFTHKKQKSTNRQLNIQTSDPKIQIKRKLVFIKFSLLYNFYTIQHKKNDGKLTGGGSLAVL